MALHLTLDLVLVPHRARITADALVCSQCVHKCRYLDAPEAHAADAHDGGVVHRCDARRAVRLAVKHGKRLAAMQLLASLRAFDDALALAETYDERLAVVEEVRKRYVCDGHGLVYRTLQLLHGMCITFEVQYTKRVRSIVACKHVFDDVKFALDWQVADADQRNALWLTLIQQEIDAAEGASGSVANRIEAIDRCVGDRLAQGALAVEDALSLLPEQRTLHHYKRVLLKHMEATTHKVRNPCCVSC